MSTLDDLLRARTDLADADVDWLHRLVAEWQLVADLAFSDLVLRVRSREGGWLSVAHMRPTTGSTVLPDDIVGLQVPSDQASRLERAWRLGRVLREGEVERGGGRVVRQEVVPVRRAGRPLALLTRETDAAAPRMPSQLELTYLTTAGELVQMVSEGTFPYAGFVPDPETAPRVGDGLLRLDRTGHVVYASPNALSAHRRLGVTGDLLGAHLGSTVARLPAGPGRLDEPRGSAALAGALRFLEPRESEVEAQGATVLLRVLPLVPGGEPRGALVLVRDVTDLRRRDRQILGKDATIREIHHRVKNNLQTVAALLRLQARRLDAPEARAALEESVRRVSSIAMVHETLSHTLEEQVAFDGVADQVLAMCAEVAAPESRVTVERRGRFGQLPSGVATALALVLTELVQNAVEHAFPAPGRADPGAVVVTARRTPGALVATVADDGSGLPDGFDVASSSRLGLQIVRTLVDSELRGTLTLQPGERAGTTVTVSVPLDEPAAGPG
jgi:two-component system, sensor histidine kinase PdtaS